ncbi:Retrovirus-related Pol polyprotein from transposon gypsy [Lucilia cuprina]|nr:Retrovirus-related Pol polyprotein from transposon gypsy [Lucilia cuprina]
MLAEYEFDIEYVKGRDNKVADFLSRLESDDEVTEDCDIKSMSEISEEMATVHSQQEDDGSANFFISNSVVNKYNIGNHRGILENFREIKDSHFYQNLIKYINKFINSCKICNENKYDRNRYRKHFNHTITPERPNMIVHMDIFHVWIHRTYFLTTIDRFTKLGSVHKITDKNKCTVKVKIQERVALLGKPELLIMDNEFNNDLIRLFCGERNIQKHFTTVYSHTGNSDIERKHLSLLKHIRILKRSNENVDVEELVIKAIGFYNGTIHSTQLTF